MGIYFGEPINKTAAKAHELLPEFNGFASGVTSVPEGGCGFGSLDNIYVSLGFSVCSGIAIINREQDRSGFIHLYPGEEIEELDVEQLKLMDGASATIIEGSARRYKEKLIQKIFQQFHIKRDRLIEVETTTSEKKTEPFHIVFRPAKNKIVIARISHADSISFPAFSRL